MKKVDIAFVVDDDPIYVYSMKRLNEISEFCQSLMVFQNGKEAFEKLSSIVENEEQLPEVIFLDINMPVWDGWQFLDKFDKIESGKTIYIYVISSSDNPEDIEKANSYKSVNNFVVKPISIDKLEVIMNEVA